MIVSLRHPSALLHVPRGGRLQRLDFRALTTPVDVPELPEGSFRAVHRLPPKGQMDEAIDLFLHRDGLWARLAGWGDGLPTEQIGMAFGREAFLRFLAGESSERIEYWLPHTDLAKAVARSPLEARFEAGKGGHPLFRVTDEYPGLGAMKDGSSRGIALDPARSRDIVLDDEPHARSAASRFVSDRFALCGDDVFHRLAGPLAKRGGGSFDVTYEANLFPYTLTLGDGVQGLVSPDRMAEHLACHARRSGRGPEESSPKASARLLALVKALPSGLPGDAEAVTFANLAPERVLRIASTLLDEPYMAQHHPGGRERMLALGRPFETWAIRAMTGGIPSTEAHAIAEATVALSRAADEIRSRNTWRHELAGIAAHAEDAILKLGETALDTADEDALGMLAAPGP